MKTLKTIGILLLVLSATSCFAAKKPVSPKKTLQQKIETKDFTIFVNRCLPTDLVNSTFNTDVALKIKDDVATADLPFHGLLNVNPNEMTSGPVTFNGPVKEYTMTPIPTKGWNVFFKVDGDKYDYQVEIEISTKGTAVIRVKSLKRSTMTYFGDVD